jgi:hypothetical protein
MVAAMTRRPLLKLWVARDKRYALQRKPEHRLTEAMVASIRAYRLREVELLDSESDRIFATVLVSQWTPPLDPAY